MIRDPVVQHMIRDGRPKVGMRLIGATSTRYRRDTVSCTTLRSRLPPANPLHDANGPVGIDNPLRQVIVATHSPYFVQLQDEDDLVLVKNAMTNTGRGVVHRLKCQPYVGSWRCSSPPRQGIDRVSLQSCPAPPEGARIALD